ncbi:phosphate-selective porin O and P [Parvibaculum lavamentivorans DS-1]|uniref:Phosphate-selective porin O and P n=1 Tax=Parvibaculum lavamentivorans (strain DS-1 / DSM 13023 / NCIMB 13966) TaxID=402881 RepID=A7HP38_PARL1|nr:phosphate porin [Parvibaculum lavamentivorans]ABS61671.1 phosphate-selective porin O and P [Parvibaculum lavamentivorans DS-1]
MTLKNILLAGTALGAAVFMTAPAFAASNTQAELDALKAQIEALQRKVDDVQIQHGNAIKSLEERKSDVEVSLKDGRPVFKSADGNFTFGITGRAHLDVGGYDMSDSDEANMIAATGNPDGLRGNANFRRLRLGFNGTFAKDFGYNIEFNFGDSGTESDARIYEALLTYKGIEGVNLVLGATKPKMTLDDSTSSNDITFIERATAVNLAITPAAGEARMTAGGTFNTDNFFGATYYTAGSAASGGGLDDYDSSNVVGRLAYATSPKEGLNVHIGASASHSFNLPGDSVRFRDRPELRVDADRYIDANFAGAADTATVYGPELAFNYGPFRAQGEYYRYEVDGIAGGSADMDAWYLQASWILTGESYKYDIKKAAYSGVKPDNPFGFGGGGAGAWEVAARYSHANLNDTSIGLNGGEQDIITVGLNWYANNNLRFMLNYLDVDVEDRGAAQLDFGHQALALRTQFAF